MDRETQGLKNPGQQRGFKPQQEAERGMEEREEEEGEAALPMTLEHCERCPVLSSYRLSDTNILPGRGGLGPLVPTAIHHL